MASWEPDELTERDEGRNAVQAMASEAPAAQAQTVHGDGEALAVGRSDVSRSVSSYEISPLEREDERARFRRDFESDDYPEPEEIERLKDAPTSS